MQDHFTATHQRTAAKLVLPCNEESLLACLDFYELACLLCLLLPFQQYNLIMVPCKARPMYLYMCDF